MLEVCPTDVVPASADRIWALLTTPRALAAWSETRLIQGPARELKAGDRLILGAGLAHRIPVSFLVREAVRPHRLAFDIRLPLGVTNEEAIRITPLGSNKSRVTYN
jgi:uncharacterized protein YndB with AHSA1/START domain